MHITKEHIDYKKVIGKLRKNGAPVHEVRTTGGLYLVIASDGKNLRTLGTGPHRAVARFIAEKNEPDLLITDLSKSDSIDEATLLLWADVFQKITARLQK